MNARGDRSRGGRCYHEYPMMLVLLLIACLAALRLLAAEQPATRPLWDRVGAAALGLLQCFGLVVGASILLVSLEFAKQTAARFRQRRVEGKQARLLPLLHSAADSASPETLRQVVRLLGDADPGVRQHALAAAYCLLRSAPQLERSPACRTALEVALLLEPGFARTLHEADPSTPLPELVTLGAKIGAGSAEKRIAPVTSDPAALANWVHQHRDPERWQELQVSIGYDTGSLPYLAERGRFLALFVFIASTDLKRFQALAHRPTRDPNAAFGLLIRGDVVEVRYPGQARGRRLDYVFPLPATLSPASLGEFVRGLQVLNLGMLLACVEDTWRTLLPGAPPSWLGPRARAAARVYRGFERQLVSLLRQHDRYRDPRLIHPLVPADHAERAHAFRTYRLEECLYPQYGWVVPLYSTDDRWARLLPPLRAVEAMMLHQGEVEGRSATRGLDFIQKVRLLGYRTVAALDDALVAEDPPETPALPPDPFLGGDEQADTDYLRAAGGAIWAGRAVPEDLPDPATFRKAAVYYHVERAEGLALPARSPGDSTGPPQL